MTKADLIIHPARLRIIQSFGGGRRLTAQELAALVPDIPRASLYRHLNLLLDGGVLAVVEERPARAIQERVYALVATATNLGPADYTATDAGDHLRYFSAFLELLRNDFTRYLRHGAPVNLAVDGVAYYQMPLFLSDDEYEQFVATMQATLWPIIEQRPNPDRRKRLLSIIVMPGVEPAPASLPADRAGDEKPVVSARRDTAVRGEKG
jgi:DNA-binding transcriptional ArsR family regulator